jgi:putative tryptophan/tyrosine transport system substrate-binding protein
MKRREFIGVSAMFALTMRYAFAQQSRMKKRIAVVSPVTKVADMRIGGDAGYDTFFNELKRLGYAEGENLIVERYSAEGVPDRYPDLAKNIVSTNPDVICSAGTGLSRQLKAATNSIPIVAITGDPIRLGLISSLAHPGGNITGVSVDAGIEIWGKRLSLLAEAVPKLRNIVFLSSKPAWEQAGGVAMREAAEKLGTLLTSVIVSPPFDEAEYRRSFGSIEGRQVDAITFSDEFAHYANRFLLVQLVGEIRLPAIYVHRDQVQAGGLMSYSYNGAAAVRQNAKQVVEIFHGANPSDMPYIQEARFELVINLKTAKALGLELPDGLIARADEVIE